MIEETHPGNEQLFLTKNDKDDIIESLHDLKREVIHTIKKTVYTLAVIRYIVIVGVVWIMLHYYH